MKPRTLADFPGESRPSGDQINYKHCPVCGSTAWKVFIDPDKGKWVCFGGRHPAPVGGGYPGGDLRIEGSEDAPGQHILDLLHGGVIEPEWGEIELPEWEPLSNTAVRYLKRRGIGCFEAAALGIVEWTDKFRTLIPYFDTTGQLVFWTSRRYSDQLGEGPKYLTAPGKHPLYECMLLPPNMPFSIPCVPVIVEGVFDAIAVTKTSGYRGIALGGKSLPRYLESLLLTAVRGCGIIYILLDRDAMAHAIRLRSFLTTKAGVTSADVRFCPHNKDPGDMTPEAIREVLR